MPVCCCNRTRRLLSGSIDNLDSQYHCNSGYHQRHLRDLRPNHHRRLRVGLSQARPSVVRGGHHEKAQDSRRDHPRHCVCIHRDPTVVVGHRCPRVALVEAWMNLDLLDRRSQSSTLSHQPRAHLGMPSDQPLVVLIAPRGGDGGDSGEPTCVTIPTVNAVVYWPARSTTSNSATPTLS